MTDLIKNNAKHRNWLTTHTFDNCKLERKEYGEFLSNYITGEHSGFVLNLNGSWGTGKTEFLKRIYSNLLEKEHPVIYIDAWESDFSKDPLTVVTSELLNQLEKFNEGIGSEKATNKVKQYCGKAIKSALVGVAGVASAKLLNDSNIGMEAIKQLIESDSESFTSQLTKDYSEQVDAIQKIRESLGQLAEVLNKNYSAKLPAIILIDELDRCRPTYAIEMLEVVKHFFTTENFVFVIATDTEQLCHSITSVYGSEFDSNQYLKRFFDRKASLPEPDLKNYINVSNKDYSAYSSLELFPLIYGSNVLENVNGIIAMLATAYALKIRDVDQLLNKIQSCLRAVCSIETNTKETQLFNFPALVIGLIEQDKNFISYSERDNSTCVKTPAINGKVKFSKDLSIDTFIDLTMDFVTTKTTKSKNDWGEIVYGKRLPNRSDLKVYIQENTSNEVHNLVNSLSGKASEYTNQPSQKKYWMWSDIKKLIELAGNIE